MSLCLKFPEECEEDCSDVARGDCACDPEKIGVLRAYVEEQFPDHVVREFHSHSTVVQDGVPAPGADHHVVRIGDEGLYCAVLTREFLAQPVEHLDERLRQWDLASTLRVDRTVIVGSTGISPA